MTRSILLFLFFFQTFFPSAISQKLRKLIKEIIAELQTDIGYLTNDKLEGRRSGTPARRLHQIISLLLFRKRVSNRLVTAEPGGSSLKFMMAGISAGHALRLTTRCSA
jgi:hypothetical protein